MEKVGIAVAVISIASIILCCWLRYRRRRSDGPPVIPAPPLPPVPPQQQPSSSDSGVGASPLETPAHSATTPSHSAAVTSPRRQSRLPQTLLALKLRVGLERSARFYPPASSDSSPEDSAPIAGPSSALSRDEHRSEAIELTNMSPQPSGSAEESRAPNPTETEAGSSDTGSQTSSSFHSFSTLSSEEAGKQHPPATNASADTNEQKPSGAETGQNESSAENSAVQRVASESHSSSTEELRSLRPLETHAGPSDTGRAQTPANPLDIDSDQPPSLDPHSTGL